MSRLRFSSWILGPLFILSLLLPAISTSGTGEVYPQKAVNITVAFAAGGFIYMALVDLMPELHKKTRYGKLSAQIATLLAGIGLMGWLKMIY